MTENELIAKAKNRYPIGTEFKSAYSGVKYTSSGEFYTQKNGIRDKNGENPWFLYEENWANIISYPPNYTPINQLSNLYIW